MQSFAEGETNSSKANSQKPETMIQIKACTEIFDDLALNIKYSLISIYYVNEEVVDSSSYSYR